MLGAFNRLRRAKTAGFSFGSRRKYREGPEGGFLTPSALKCAFNFKIKRSQVSA